MKYPVKISLPALMLLTVVQSRTLGAVTSATSSAEDISASGIVTGSLLGLSLGTINIGVEPVNAAQGTSPNAYDFSPPSLVNLKSTGAGAVALNLSVNADNVHAASNVDGLDGLRNTTASSGITAASAGLGLNLGPVLGSINIFTIGLTAAPATVISAESGIAWDGASLTSTSTSNLLGAPGNSITLSVLGTPVVIGTLTAGVETLFPINVNLGDITVTGTIGLTADDFDSLLAGNSAFGTATTLSVAAALHIAVPGVLPGADTSVDLNTTVAVNQTSAQMTAAPVPEIGSATGLIAATGVLLLRRRRI